jgi:hypothetical protein
VTLPHFIGTRWLVRSSRTGYADDPITTAAVKSAITRIQSTGGHVDCRDWYMLHTWDGRESISYRPQWVRTPPTPGTWRALHHCTHLPELQAVRGRGEGLRVGCGENLAASNTTWSLIERGLVEVDGDTAAITPIGWRLAAAHRRDTAARATRRALHAARQRHNTALTPNALVRAA